jgi:tetraether lipid synthase
VLPETLERRITFPDVVRAIAEQTDGLYREADFLPLPCAHPNCHSLSYAYRSGGAVVPISRFIDAEHHLDLLANGITFTRASARELIESYLGRLGCCAGGDCSSDSLSLRERAGVRAASTSDDGFPSGPPTSDGLPILPADALASANGSPPIAHEFFSRALAEQLSPSDVFRITITSFLDAYNFDVRRLMKCCIHHVLPSGHVIPFCAYNVLYRDGHVPLPELRGAIAKLVQPL